MRSSEEAAGQQTHPPRLPCKPIAAAAKSSAFGGEEAQ
jgi:hypothetical protein